MKKLVFSLFVTGVVVLLLSCQKENLLDDYSQLIGQISTDANAVAIGVNELPASITKTANAEFPKLDIEMAFRSNGMGYMVLLEDGYSMFFNMQNQYLNQSKGLNGNHGMGNQNGMGGGGNSGMNGGMNGGMGGNGNGSGSSGTMGGTFSVGNHCLYGDTLVTINLPLKAQEYLNKNYPGWKVVVEVIKPSGKLGVELSDGTILLFDVEGNFIKVCDGELDCGTQGGNGHNHGNGGGMMKGGMEGTNHCIFGEKISTGNLPELAKVYITTNFPKDAIVTVVKKPHGDFAVELSNGRILMFNSKGEYFTECGTHGGFGNGWGGTEITADQLPKAALTYIQTEHAGTTVQLAIKTFGGKYFIRLSDSTKIVFNTDGTVLFDSGK